MCVDLACHCSHRGSRSLLRVIHHGRLIQLGDKIDAPFTALLPGDAVILRVFKADPEHYAPQFGNFCAMALALNQVVVANPENWLISDGKLYVFGKAAPFGPELFQKNLVSNITKANQNRSILPKE